MLSIGRLTETVYMATLNNIPLILLILGATMFVLVLWLVWRDEHSDTRHASMRQYFLGEGEKQ